MCQCAGARHTLPPTRLGEVTVGGAIQTASSAAAIVTNPIGAIMSGLNPVLSVFGLNSSDPQRDAERAARIYSTFRAAMGGDQNAVACLRDMAQGVSSGPSDPRQCAVGSKVAAALAAKMWREYQIRYAAGGVGSELIRESTIPTTIAQAMTSPWTLLAIGGGLYLLSRRSRRRASR